MVNVGLYTGVHKIYKLRHETESYQSQHLIEYNDSISFDCYSPLLSISQGWVELAQLLTVGVKDELDLLFFTVTSTSLLVLNLLNMFIACLINQ